MTALLRLWQSTTGRSCLSPVVDTLYYNAMVAHTPIDDSYVDRLLTQHSDPLTRPQDERTVAPGEP
ncbi:hypothetical protein [Phytohabitans suffuscus]|uniref:Uncharacterized protein n=1 Tax=Phytohabitans suffuscus TaxID=624315 RepID=A0A6F8YAL7_9ACTN|nr:hypothetical protein [Phytohabitans suffuscus]BCB83145.1 hypothetical protein Psuf_004580 [Phytohabitans suffuscus]